MYVPRSLTNRLSRVFVLLLAVGLGACSDLDLFSPNRDGGSASLSLRPYFGVISGSQNAADITRVRLTVKVLPSGPTLPAFDMSVDPSQTAWDLPIEVPSNSEISILVELLNAQNVVEFSGVIPSIRVTSGPQPTPPSVPVFPGPPENLSVTAIAVSPRDQGVLEGATINLTATVTGGSSSTRVLWSSDNAAVATVDGNGVVRTLRPGRAVITANAGRVSDAITVNVGARATRIEILPADPTLTSLEQEQTFTARVLDARNEVVPGLGVTWNIADATIATQVNAGVFKARRNGSTAITATATQGTNTITASTNLTVAQRAISIAIAPTTRFFDAFGATEQFTVEARDANGARVEGGAVTWTSSNAAVATVSATGLVTAVGNGTATIRAESGGQRAEATVTVQQRVAAVAISPSSVILTFINDTEQLTATARDPRGNVINAPVRWFSQNSAVAGVDGDRGIVTANGDGTTIVFAEVGGARAAAAVHVRRAPTQIVFDRKPFTLNAGTSQPVQAFVADEGGAPIGGDTIVWSSTNEHVAIVSPFGLVTGFNAGTTEIVARARGFEARLTVTVVGTAPTGGLRPNSNGKVLLLHADGGGMSFVGPNIAAQSGGALSVSNMAESNMGFTPTPLATLLNYGAIFLWTNFSPSNPVAWGDRLKEYVDAGGKVVMAVYAFSNTGDPWEMQGGIMGAGYSPFVLTNDRYFAPFSGITLNFGTALIAHPILNGVTEFQFGGNSNYTKVQVAPGATLVAKDNNNIPVIGTNATGSVIGFNLYPGNVFPKSNGVWKAIANALK